MSAARPRTLGKEAMAAWQSYLRGHAVLRRALNAGLVAGHGLTINDYEVMLILANAPERRLKRIELAQRVVLTPSGITRLLDGLERAGCIEKGTCPSDARVTYAVLTDAGLARLREAAETHVADVDELFASRYSDEELELLGELLGRIAGDGDHKPCTP
jgi:DNA-binding MarR family transcriptional regulator